MDEREVKRHKNEIDGMTQTSMAWLHRFAPVGHIYFDNTLPLNKYFMDRFKKLGGITPAISKEIGW